MVREMIEALMALEHLVLGHAAHGDVVNGDREHRAPVEVEAVGRGLDAAERAVLAVLAHLDRGAGGGVLEPREQHALVGGAFGAEELREGELAHLVVGIAGVAQRRRVGRDDLQCGGVEDQGGRGPLGEHGLAGGDGAGSSPAPAHEVPRAKPKCGTPESGEGAEAECQMVHAASLNLSFESLAEAASARPCAAHSLRRSTATMGRTRGLRRARAYARNYLIYKDILNYVTLARRLEPRRPPPQPRPARSALLSPLRSRHSHRT